MRLRRRAERRLWGIYAWAAFVDGTNYPDLGIEVPALSDEQIECGAWAYGWWF
jgi:hypothetical protein